MKDKSEVAVDIFLSGYNCAQAVLYSHSDDFKLDMDTALRLACGLGAGMGRRQEVCGAVSGGILVIGLKHGRGLTGDKTYTEKTYALTRELMEKFEQRHGSCICRKLLNGCNLLTDEGQKYFKENDLLNKECKECVNSVVEILKDILREAAGEGRAIMKRSMINSKACRSCKSCEVERQCKMKAVIRESPDEKPWIDFYKCSGCMKCKLICPGGAIDEIVQPCNGKGRMGW